MNSACWVAGIVLDDLVFGLLFVDGFVLCSVWLLRKARSRRGKKDSDAFNMVLFCSHQMSN